MDISTRIGSLKLENPTILASGILGVSRASLMHVFSNGAGACVIKSISLKERVGHHAPNMITYEGGMLNAVGYSNPGVDEAREEFKELNNVGGPVLASIIGQNAEEFGQMAEKLLPGEFSAVEAVLSCPHTPGYGTMAGQGTPKSTEEITKAIRSKTQLPLFIKISPDSQPIGEVAKAAEAAGADGIVAVNTMGPGMIVDIQTGQPILHFKVGGVSGVALRPIAVRCIYDIRKAVKIPIIGVGGVTTGRDAVEMMMVGATAVEIGTAIYSRGIDVFAKVSDEIRAFMQEKGYKKLEDFVSLTHKLEG